MLFYHGVAPTILDPSVETESINAGDFERQLKYISKHFRPITIDEFYSRYINHDWEGREILLTFDDGYRNLLTTGLPLLQKYNIPFALFVTVDNINNNLLFPTTVNRLVNLAENCDLIETNRVSKLLKTEPLDKVENICCQLLKVLPPKRLDELRIKYASINPMTWDEVRQIDSSPLCTIGSHCMSHICCHAKQDEDEVFRQFSESKRIITEKLGKDCIYLSYPNGSFTPTVKSIARECRYKMAFSTRYEAVDSQYVDTMAVGRIYVPYDYSRFVYAISRFPR